ncbi:MAG: imidazolonepropionase [Planctomycetota bacterium]
MAGDLRLERAMLDRGSGKQELCTLTCSGGRIVSIEPSRSARGTVLTHAVDAGGMAVLPGLVDCHTHACWVGCRLDEWERMLRGEPYLDILASGGGIMATVRAVRDASEGELADATLRHLDQMLRHGTTAAEIKSGYGLDTESELAMLRAVTRAGEQWAGAVVPTACIGHAKDPDLADGGVRRAIEQTLPAVTAEFPGIAVDAYCERGAWSLEETLRLVDAALEAGHPVRVHADQFHDLGMIPEAIARGVVSVDHLEASRPDSLEMLAASDSFGVMLPACGWHLDDRYADGRRFLDLGGKLALASNYNPGSAPSGSLPMIVAIAVRRLGLTPAEAVRCVTRSAADLLGFADRGRLEVGAHADLVLLDTPDPRDVAYRFGHNPVACVWIAGERVV